MLHRLVGSLILVISLGLGWAMMQFNQFVETPLQLPLDGVVYTLAPGMTTRLLAEDLTRRGYLRNPIYLRLLARWEDKAHQLKAGEYLLPSGTTPRGLLDLLVSGRVTSYALTLIEGWNFHQVMEAVLGSADLKQTLGGLNDAQIMAQLGYPGQHPEGRFLPDTYHFPKGTTDLEFLRRAYQAMHKILEQKWQERDPKLPLKSSYEALILASIVEKETGLASERPLIAGVFVRRLNTGMRLQTDPTIIYGLGADFDGNIRRRDLKKDTPYNTYIHKGLTPTPIAMPGIDALHAAVHPAQGNSLFFVAKGDGSHHFSDTLAEHNRAVRKYQLKK